MPQRLLAPAKSSLRHDRPAGGPAFSWLLVDAGVSLCDAQTNRIDAVTGENTMAGKETPLLPIGEAELWPV